MKQGQRRGRLLVLAALALILVACEAQNGPLAPNEGTATPPLAAQTLTPGRYPLLGHAPDFSWVAGQVQAAYASPHCGLGPWCGCATLRFAENGSPMATEVQLNGRSWDAVADTGQVPAGSYRILFGHLHHSGVGTPEAIHACPSGLDMPAYMVDRIEEQPAMPDALATLTPFLTATPIWWMPGTGPDAPTRPPRPPTEPPPPVVTAAIPQPIASTGPAGAPPPIAVPSRGPAPVPTSP